jgi:hypothetical protein
VLEGLGWRLVRVWSSDWVRDREKQVRRVLAALERAKSGSDEPTPADVPKLTMVKRKSAAAKPPEFDSIDDAPAAAVEEAVVGALAEFGSMPTEDLIAAASRRLGFKRTGPKIRERVTETINARIAAGTLRVDDADRIRPVSAPAGG